LSEQHESILIELDSEREIHAIKESLAQISSEPKKILRKSHTSAAAADDDTPETDSLNSNPLPRSSSLPLPHHRSSLALPAIDDDEEDDVDQEKEDEEDRDILSNEPILKKSKARTSSPPPINSEAEAISPRRPTSGKSSRKRTASVKPPQPPLNKGTKSPRKMSFQDQNASSDPTKKHQQKPSVSSSPSPPPLPVVTSVDVSTSIDLNLTRLSRVHRFIQTDMYSTEYGGLVNQVADLTTELEEKEKIIATLKKDNLVCLPD
jgi:hypothetical protein